MTQSLVFSSEYIHDFFSRYLISFKYSLRKLFKQDFLENSAKFKGKHLCLSFETPKQVFNWEVCKIFKKYFFYRTPLNDRFLISRQLSCF